MKSWQELATDQRFRLAQFSGVFALVVSCLADPHQRKGIAADRGKLDLTYNCKRTLRCFWE